MNNSKLSATQTAHSWDSYWRGDTSSHAYSSSGVNHEDVSAYWQTLFSELSSSGTTSSMIDIASGNGALPELAQQYFSDGELRICAVDVSKAAVDNIQSRFPNVECVVADASTMPTSLGTFDLVISQFGIEYAGIDAIEHATEFISPGGTFAMMMHCQGSKIDQECATNKAALQALRESLFIELATDMFKHGFAAVAGADRQPYDQAAIKLGAALPTVESAITEYGEDVAGGLLVQLYNDVSNIHSRMPHYRPEDILPWLTKMNQEANAYVDRMQSMIDAALSDQEFLFACSKLEEAGLQIIDNEKLTDQQTGHALAWIIRATK